MKEYEAVLARLKFYKAFYLTLVALEKAEVRRQVLIQLFSVFSFKAFFLEKRGKKGRPFLP